VLYDRDKENRVGYGPLVIMVNSFPSASEIVSSCTRWQRGIIVGAQTQPVKGTVQTNWFKWVCSVVAQ
jgi:C-terminal processing protease CtpA/Prc